MNILKDYSTKEALTIGITEKDLNDLDRLELDLCGKDVKLFLVPYRPNPRAYSILELSIRNGIEYTGKIINALTGEDYTRDTSFKQEAYYRSSTLKQEFEWKRRKLFNKLLTIDDMLLVDNIVDKVIKKHTQ